MALQTISVRVGGELAEALVDTGCSQTIVKRGLVGVVSEKGVRVTVADGSTVRCVGVGTVDIIVDGRKLALKCLVMEKLPRDFEVILGMDAIGLMGGVSITRKGVCFLSTCAAMDAKGVETVFRAEETRDPSGLQITDEDFSARFVNGKWIASWKWDKCVPELTNKVPHYGIEPDLKGEFDAEVDSWIEQGWLKKCDDDAVGILPMMVIDQKNKGKVRPVLDYRELNAYVKTYTGDSDVCDRSTRRWRRFGERVAMLDLKKAYLQIHIEPELWKFQKVRYKGGTYYLTRLGFGLNVAPKIMSTILRRVLSLREDIRESTDNYIDDVIVDTSRVSIETVVSHLSRYGLEVKEPGNFDGARVLGLQIGLTGKRRIWSRGNEFPKISSAEKITRRELFSVCGQLVGHYPVARWLRIACSFAKRMSVEGGWEDDVGAAARVILTDILDLVQKDDPVRGSWHVSGQNYGIVWCDASSIAYGVSLEINGEIVEDAAWLRKNGDVAHINVAELDGVIRGVNLALKWDLKSIIVKTDSSTVRNWLSSTLTGRNRVRTHGPSEMLIRRRLQILEELREAFGLDLTVDLVPSEKNKADELTRVKKVWL